MARINSEITIKQELRPCILFGKEKALFHCWEQQTNAAHSRVNGLVELEGGHMMMVNPVNIRFIDNKHEEIYWNEEEAEE